VQRKREDVSFSPKDQASADAFLQVWSSFQNMVGHAEPYDYMSLLMMGWLTFRLKRVAMLHLFSTTKV